MIELAKKKILSFDFEVAAIDFNSYDSETQTYLTKYAKDYEERKAIIDSLVFNPFTSQLVAIGMLDVNEDKGCVLMNTDAGVEIQSENDTIKYICKDEKGIIDLFWKVIKDKSYNLFT